MRALGIPLVGLLTVAVAIGVGSTPRAAFSDGAKMVQYVQSVNGTMSSPYIQTITVSAQRERIDSQPGSGIGTEVIECDRQRIVDWPARGKTYYVESFGWMAQLYAGIAKSMKAHGQSALVDRIQESPDSKTTIIDGITAHHLVETQGAEVSDLWYARGANPFECPAFDAIAFPGPKMRTSISSSGALIALAKLSIGTFAGSRAPAGSMILRQSILLSPRWKVLAEVTAIKTLPYDPNYFDPPLDFVEASPRPVPSF